MRRGGMAVVLLVALGCDGGDTEAATKSASEALKRAKQGAKHGYAKAESGVRSGTHEAARALRKAEDKARRGYSKAKARVDAIDWVQAFESTRDGIDQASDALTSPRSAPSDPGPADAWWNRGADAVTCEDDRCTVSAWFVEEARSNPTRMMGDVKVFTAPDESGWLLDSVRPGSAAHVMGFRAGDVVRTIGGHPLTNNLARLEILATLRSAHEVDTTFVRKGQTEVSTLTIRFER